jgi:hypothetical protein
VRWIHPFHNFLAVETLRLSPVLKIPAVEFESMQGPLRTILAGAAAWKLGGGCISTILIFIIVFWALGYVNC